MKVNELSKITGTHIETIRSYRNKGLLKPKKLANGYYNYGISDFISLAYIRKMRGYSISLDNISEIYSTDEPGKIIELIEAEQQVLRTRLARMEEEIRYLELEKIHVRESWRTGDFMVQTVQSLDDKIDIYPEDLVSDPGFRSLLEISHMMTPTVRISKEVLNGSCEDRIIPIRTGVGTYRYVLSEKGIPLPEGHNVIPNGIHISQMITLKDLSEISLKQLQPMMDEAKKNGTPFISDTTGYLMHVEKRSDDLVYHFRIRACIETNDIISAKP
ncbi:MAG: MerR family transcriptional regulator [Solobacterium sp.]|nr:MerR family transcriptional regulator [Solobacterium sp.]